MGEQPLEPDWEAMEGALTDDPARGVPLDSDVSETAPSVDNLAAVLRPSRFRGTPHLVATVNGQPLDELLSERSRYPVDVRGLVVTLDKWNLQAAEDRHFVWSRVLPADQSSNLLPILVCPDDGDFECPTVVTEVRRRGDSIQWNRFGLASSYRPMPPLTAEDVEWFDEGDPLTFDLHSYSDFAEACRSLSEE